MSRDTHRLALPKLPALRTELKALCRLGDVRVSFRDGELRVTSDFMICDKLEAALAAYGYEWVGPRYKANGKIQPEVEGVRHDSSYCYEYFVYAEEAEPEPEPEPGPKATIEMLIGDAHFLRGYFEQTIKSNEEYGRTTPDEVQSILKALKAAGIVEQEVTHA